MRLAFSGLFSRQTTTPSKVSELNLLIKQI